VLRTKPEVYKDKIEVSLDGRQIFYLFFGGAVIVGMVFVLGVMVGRRVEARGHVDRAARDARTDPLAALDRLEAPPPLSLAKGGGATPPPVDATIAALAGGAGADGKSGTSSKPDGSKSADGKLDGKTAKDDKGTSTSSSGADGKDGSKSAVGAAGGKDGAKSADSSASKAGADGTKDGAKSADGSSSKAGSDGTKGTSSSSAAAGGKDGAKSTDGSKASSSSSSSAAAGGKTEEKKTRYTIQLSSFQDRSEAESYLDSLKSSGYGSAYITEADVPGKGTFYRVRLGSYKSIDAANDARSELEKAGKKSPQVMKL